MSSRRTRDVRRVVLVTILQIALLVGIIVLWQVLTDDGGLDKHLVSSPGAIWDQLRNWQQDGTLWSNTASTLKVLSLGWLLGVLGGTVLGVVAGLSRWAWAYLEPFLVFANAMPRLLLLPFLIVWLGVGLLPKILLVLSVVVVMVALTVAAGVREVGEAYVDNAVVLGAGRRHVAMDVYLPSIALWVLSSARTTVGYAFQAAVVSEFIGNGVGLGALIVSGQTLTNVDVVFAAITVMIVLAVIIDAVLGQVQRRLTRWMPADI